MFLLEISSGGILSGGILERGDIVRGDFVLGGYCPGGYCPRTVYRGPERRPVKFPEITLQEFVY